METIAEKIKRQERRKIANEVLKYPLGKYSIPATTTPFDVAFMVRAEIATSIREGGK